MIKKLLFAFLFFGITLNIIAQHSPARDWNERVLQAIREDNARPTIHARNLFHSSIIMYDAWAVFDDTAETVILGKTFGGFTCNFNGIAIPTDKEAAAKEVMSYALYRLLLNRFQYSPGVATQVAAFNQQMTDYGYDINFTSQDYSTGSYAALGNYFGQKMIDFGLQDGANEYNFYNNQHYTEVNGLPVNNSMQMDPGDYTDMNDLVNPNRWQPLSFETFIDQSGNVIPGATPEFISPEWGEVTPFALDSNDLQILNNGVFDSYVYSDPGAPYYIQNSASNGISDPYKWNFALVLAWSAHLDPTNTTTINISPSALGNLPFSSYPTNFAEYQTFYNFTTGGVNGANGHALNPSTGAPYPANVVKLSDYGRILAEFWADGPDSETPPGHWFTILNYVNDHPSLVKKMQGSGPVLTDLEWDVKMYLALGGAMHDSAVNTWGVKGYYDYVRPVSAIRYMAWKGQSSDPGQPSFDPHGLPLIPGLVELIQIGDPLAGAMDENVGKIKVFAWKGPDYITDPETDAAGVGWILGTRWWPYQRPTFVSPPFAGYVSGHSTFSRAAAEVLTMLTGDAFFPGGVGTFDAVQNDFLVFEEGPTQNITLQWATYRDASDQTSLSRIWGGIHPPIDDIPGRIIGEKVGIDAANKALAYFDASILSTEDVSLIDNLKVYPVPFKDELNIALNSQDAHTIALFDVVGRKVYETALEGTSEVIKIPTYNLKNGVYFVKVYNSQNMTLVTKKVIK